MLTVKQLMKALAPVMERGDGDMPIVLWNPRGILRASAMNAEVCGGGCHFIIDTGEVVPDSN